jgi:hypothetical protein
MMKETTRLALAGLGAAMLVLAASASSPAEVDLTQRVETLELDLERARQKVTGLSEEVARTGAVLDRLQKWVAAQAEGAKSLSATLDTSEQQGFTAGINFTSRETLLAGWRQSLGVMAQGLTPAAKVD